jgi:hypothetical protein
MSTDADTSLADAFTVAGLARRWHIGPDKVRALIRKGELVAVNVATDPCGRPQWRILAESVHAFETLRASSPPPPKAPRRRQRREGFVDYFPD